MQRNIINDYYFGGLQNYEIRQKYNINDDQFQAYRKQGIKMLKKFCVKSYRRGSDQPNKPDEHTQTIIKMIEEGRSIKEMVEKTGLSREVVAMRRRRYILKTKAATKKRPALKLN